MIAKLINILSLEARVFEQFLELLVKQRQALVENDIDVLNQISERQRERLIESQLLNRERETLLEVIKSSGICNDDVSLSHLIEVADSQQAQQLSQLRDAIIELNEQITKARNSNVMLLNSAREFISRTMSMLSTLGHKDQSYAASGLQSTSGTALALDRRV